MELERAIRARRMVRSFKDVPIDPGVLTEILDLARRAPSAGHAATTEFVVLTGESRSTYWDLTLPPQRREGFTFAALPDAGALVLVLARPEGYTDRYAEPDKARTGLGEDLTRWPVPFWWVDAGAVLQNLLLLAVDRGLGACLFGVFDNEDAVSQAIGIPADRRIVGAVAMGHPTSDPGKPGRSKGRRRPPIESIIHRESWTKGDEAPR